MNKNEQVSQWITMAAPIHSAQLDRTSDILEQHLPMK